MYTVTRQMQWLEGDPVVEVSEGGIDYTNPDALAAHYPGEFEEFQNPIEAVNTAIEICRAWRRDGKNDRDEGQFARVGIGATGGYTMPFEGCSFTEAKQWAKETWEKLEKCPTCGEVVEDLQEWWQAGEYIGNDFIPFDHLDEKYCSEYCAEKASIFTGECLECNELLETKVMHDHPTEYGEWICDSCLAIHEVIEEEKNKEDKP